MERLGLALYTACVDFALRVSVLLGVTYHDVNAALFFVVFPATTILLAAWVLALTVKRNRLRR